MAQAHAPRVRDDRRSGRRGGGLRVCAAAAGSAFGGGSKTMARPKDLKPLGEAPVVLNLADLEPDPEGYDPGRARTCSSTTRLRRRSGPHRRPVKRERPKPNRCRPSRCQTSPPRPRVNRAAHAAAITFKYHRHSSGRRRPRSPSSRATRKKSMLWPGRGTWCRRNSGWSSSSTRASSSATWTNDSRTRRPSCARSTGEVRGGECPTGARVRRTHR